MAIKHYCNLHMKVSYTLNVVKTETSEKNYQKTVTLFSNFFFSVLTLYLSFSLNYVVYPRILTV